MIRTAGFLGMLAAGAFVFFVGSETRTASACSWVPFYEMEIGDQVDYTRLVALGTIEQAGEDRALLAVEEYFKGDEDARLLEINNRGFSVGADCTLSQDDDNPPQRFAEGERVLMFLEADDVGGADWRPAHFGGGVLTVTGDDVFAHGEANEDPLGTLEEYREAAGDRPTPTTPTPTPTPADEQPANGGDEPDDGGSRALWLAGAVFGALALGTGAVIGWSRLR